MCAAFIHTTVTLEASPIEWLQIERVLSAIDLGYCGSELNDDRVLSDDCPNALALVPLEGRGRARTDGDGWAVVPAWDYEDTPPPSEVTPRRAAATSPRTPASPRKRTMATASVVMLGMTPSPKRPGRALLDNPLLNSTLQSAPALPTGHHAILKRARAKQEAKQTQQAKAKRSLRGKAEAKQTQQAKLAHGQKQGRF